MGLFKSSKEDIVGIVVTSVEKPGTWNPKKEDEHRTKVEVASGVYRFEFVSNLREHITAMYGLYLDFIADKPISVSGQITEASGFARFFGKYDLFDGWIRVDGNAKYVCKPNHNKETVGCDISYLEVKVGKE